MNELRVKMLGQEDAFIQQKEIEEGEELEQLEDKGEAYHSTDNDDVYASDYSNEPKEDKPIATSFDKVQALDTINFEKKEPKKEFSDTPIVQGQKLKNGMFRVKARRIKMFDLSKEQDETSLNNLLDEHLNPNSNIINLSLKHQFSDKDGSWKILVSYELVEFKINI